MPAGTTAGGPSKTLTGRWIAAAALLGLLLRLAFALLYWTHQPMTRDEHEYLSLARSLRAGAGYVYDAELLKNGIQPFGRAPGYPVFLALVGGGDAVATSVPPSVKVAQSFLGALGIVLIAMLAHDLAGARAARAAAFIAAVYPSLVWIAAYAFSEALFWPLGLLAAWLANRLFQAPDGRARLALICGLVAGAALLVRPMMVVFPPLACAWLAWRARWKSAAALALGVAIVVGPWSIRSSFSHDRFVPLASEGGITFWTGNHPLAIGDGDMAANPRIKVAQQALRAEHPTLTEEQMEPVYYREAFAWIAAHPLDWLRLEMRKAFYLVVPIGPSYMLHSQLYVVGSLVPYLIVLPLALMGVWSARARLRQTTGLWLLTAASVLICLIFFPQERFRLPIIDPMLIVCAAAWIARADKESHA